MSNAHNPALKKIAVPVRQPDGSMGAGDRWKLVVPKEAAGTVSAGSANTAAAVNPFSAGAVEEETPDARGFYQSEIDSAAKHGHLYTDLQGFLSTGIHSQTGTRFSPWGWDWDDRNETTGETVDAAGFPEYGFYSRTHERTDEEGYDNCGQNVFGFNRDGTHESTGGPISDRGFDRNGLQENGSSFDKQGWSATNRRADGSMFTKGLDRDSYILYYPY